MIIIIIIDGVSIYSKLEINEKVYETPIERFTRLRTELNDLEINLNSLKQIEDEAKNNNNTILLLSWSNIQKEVLRLKDSQMKSLFIDDGIIIIEKRLRLLEQLLGYSSNVLDNNNVMNSNQTSKIFPLLDTVSILEGKSSYLESNNIDSLKIKIFSLKKELESSSIRDSKISKISILDQKATEYINKIEDVKKNLEQIENLVYEFPSIIIRLKSLESTHSKAANVVAKLNDIEEKILSVKGILSENSDIISTLKTGLDENGQILKHNVNSFL